MKTSIALTVAASLIARASAECFSTELGYPCCSNSKAPVYEIDDDGRWGVENGNWCGLPDAEEDPNCWASKLNYPCCSSASAEVYFTDKDGKWGVENNNWCGIPKSTGGASTTPKEEDPEEETTKEETTKEETTKTPATPATPSGEQLTLSGNPFEGVEFYINPYFVEEVDGALAQITDSSLKASAAKVKEYSNAIWLDTMKNMQSWLEPNLKGALAQQESTGKKVLTVFVVYDLPGRDCHALASNGELLANDSDWERYKTEYIDVIEGHLKNYPSQPVVLIIEPDSLANMVTNLESTPACKDSQKYYMDGHAYLIKKLGVLPNVAMYLDIGHAWWLGWDDNRQKAGKVYSEVIASGSPGKVRGFTDNVSNYTPWEDPELSRGPETDWNPCPDEKRYLEAMYKDFTAAGIKSVYFVSDSSRNGKKTDRVDSGEWCNVSGAGIGARPEANPISGMDYLDAFYWIKPIGESDGTSDESAERFDGYCGHEVSMKPAPEAGQWFQKFFEEAVKNANPPL